MPRKGPAERRELVPDPIYKSVLVTQVTNKVLERGKRTIAERIVYTALELVEQKTGADPVAALKRALENVRPELEGPHGSSTPSFDHARHSLAHRLRQEAP
jgi:small subunit ribosomal protein S7